MRNVKERTSGRHILTVKFVNDLRGIRTEGVTGCTVPSSDKGTGDSCFENVSSLRLESSGMCYRDVW